MIKLIPKTWYSKKYQILNDDQPIGHIQLALLNSTATMIINKEEYKAGKVGIFSNSFYLNKKERTFANATKPRFFSRTIQVDFDSSQFELKAQSIFNRIFQISQSEQIVGTIYQQRIFNRTINIDLPTNIKPEQQVFMAWLVITLLNRRNKSNN